MSKLNEFLTSTIGRKLIVALTGLFLISFLIVHVSGNMLLFSDDGGDAFNIYSRFMSTNPLIRVLEIGLVLGFVLHIYQSLVLTAKNRGAREVKYVKQKSHENSSWYSRNMALFGMIILVFLVIHLKSYWYEYKFGEVPMTTIEGESVKDMYKIVAESFTAAWYVAFYVISMVILAFHLVHGTQSAFQTLGLNHPSYTPTIKAVGTIFAIVVPALFAAMPLYFYFLYK